MELIIDPKSGDMISGNGNGNLRVEFDSYTPVKLFGTYTINKGNYLFTLQNVIRKDFKIDKGSTIDWTGNPFGAQVDIRGLYSVTASLTDLMDSKQLSAITSRTSVPVNCVLQLSDNLLKPTVTFDIELPTSDDGVKQLVKSIINTNEMMNKQMIYLLVFNKFFTPEYMRSYAFGADDGISFGLTTVSAQLNSWFSKMINSNNVSLGLDYKKMVNMNTDEYKAQILYQPNNRLIVNGNVGYKADNTINTTKFIKDVDIEYLLTNAGKFRAKIYNHTVDKYQIGAAVDMQGLSLMYKESFSDMNDMKNYYLGLIGIGRKKENQAHVKSNPSDAEQK
jgi:TamB, inner membrane protein subunit of TAM complex